MPGRRRHRRQAAQRRLVLDRHRRGPCRQVGHSAVDDLPPAQHPGDACREHVRLRHRGLPRRLLCRGVRRRRLRARAGRREAEGHRLRRPAGRPRRPAAGAVERQRHGAGQLRPARHRLHDRAQRRRRGPQEGDRPRLVEEPSERRQESQGASAEGRRDGHHPERADDRLAARPVRLLRRVGRRGRGHRHHARDRQGDGQAEPGERQGAAALGLQRLGVGPQFVGRQLLPHHAHRLEEGL